MLLSKLSFSMPSWLYIVGNLSVKTLYRGCRLVFQTLYCSNCISSPASCWWSMQYTQCCEFGSGSETRCRPDHMICGASCRHCRDALHSTVYSLIYRHPLLEFLSPPLDLRNWHSVSAKMRSRNTYEYRSLPSEEMNRIVYLAVMLPTLNCRYMVWSVSPRFKVVTCCFHW